MRLIGSFQTITIHGRSWTISSAPTGCSISTSAGVSVVDITQRPEAPLAAPSSGRAGLARSEGTGRCDCRSRCGSNHRAVELEDGEVAAEHRHRHVVYRDVHD